MEDNFIKIGDNIEVTTDDFKNLFTRDFPYLPVYAEGKAYFKDDEVYYTPNFYKSLTDGNTTLPTDTTNWTLINDSVDNYIQDADIMRAFNEAKVNFNAALFGDNDTIKMVFLYLAAHYLVVDLNNAQSPLAMGYMGFTQSKSVGSVSQSFALPDFVTRNAVLSQYMQTGFGAKYVSLISPYLIGNIMLIRGRTTIG